VHNIFTGRIRPYLHVDEQSFKVTRKEEKGKIKTFLFFSSRVHSTIPGLINTNAEKAFEKESKGGKSEVQLLQQPSSRNSGRYKESLSDL
jgi:hypothetical protein